ncbi:unnamed protein product, partial [Candidula unifasciata]
FRSVVSSRNYCSYVSTRKKEVNCVPEKSCSLSFSRQIGTVHLQKLVNKICYTSWASSFTVISFTDLYASARLITFPAILKLFCRSQDVWTASSVVKRVALPNTPLLGNCLIPYQALHRGKFQKYSQNRSADSAITSCCCYSTQAVSSEPKNTKAVGSESQNEESKEKMNQMTRHVSNLVYKLFSGQYNYRALHKNVVLENCLFGKKKKSVGVLSYAIVLLKLRLRIHSQFTGTSVEIENVRFLEDGVIRIRWRLKAVSQTSLLKALKLIAINADSIEACSYFHVDESGIVKKHRIEKVMPSSKEKAAL